MQGYNEDITLKLPRLHEGQQRIYNERKRFTVCNVARRWGKTTFGAGFLLPTVAMQGLPVAWYSPTYRSSAEVFKYMKKLLYPVIVKTNEQLKQIELLGGGRIDVWSLNDPDSSRGRKYARVCIDEAAMIKKLDEAWSQTIRATLSDYQGDAFRFSTPKGIGSAWHKMCQKHKENETWAYFEARSIDNPYFPKSEWDAAKRELHPAVFAQEYEAKFVALTETPWFHSFVQSKHVKEFDYWDDVPLLLSFDFNVEATCLISQKSYGEIRFLEEFKVDGGGTQNLCSVIKSSGLLDDFPDYQVTGDRSGSARSAASNRNNFEIIRDSFNCEPWHFVGVKGRNQRHIYSRELCNYALHNLDVKIHPGCEQLIFDLSSAEPKPDGSINKDRSAGQGQDLGDCFRYSWVAMYPDGVDEMKEDRDYYLQTKAAA